MDNFDLEPLPQTDFGLDAPPAAEILTQLSIAFAVLFYAAAAVLAIGTVVRILLALRGRPQVAFPTRPLAEAGWRVFTETILLRTAFFSDRFAWLFGACVHLGLVLVVLRHLRYVLEPAWLGPAWILVEIAQPLGLYGGLLLLAGLAGFWLRRLVVPSLRAASRPVDHLMLGLLLAAAGSGYLNNWLGTDVVAVKSFFLGLVLLDWKPLPADAPLLIHLWLVAVLMVLVPFSPLLHLPNLFLPAPRPRAAPRMAVRAAVAVAALLLLVPAAAGGLQVAEEGWTKPRPDFSKLARAHKADAATVMIRNHPDFLMNVRAVVVDDGVREANDTIENCVNCHVVKDEAGQPVDHRDPRHYCSACHTRAAVTIDCFECHNSKPTGPQPEQAALPGAALAQERSQP